MTKEIKTEIIIQASPQKVWKVLTDFKNYSSWNPFITSLQGVVGVGSYIQITLVTPGKSAMKIRPKVLVFEAYKEFRWKGQLLFPGLFDGEHIFELLDNQNGSTTLVHREEFNGILISFFTKMLEVNTLSGFKLMNQKLKEIVETT